MRHYRLHCGDDACATIFELIRLLVFTFFVPLPLALPLRRVCERIRTDSALRICICSCFLRVSVYKNVFSSWGFTSAVGLGSSCLYDGCGARDRIPIDWDMHLRFGLGASFSYDGCGARAIVFQSVGICICSWFRLRCAPDCIPVDWDLRLQLVWGTTVYMKVSVRARSYFS